MAGKETAGKEMAGKELASKDIAGIKIFKNCYNGVQVPCTVLY